MRVFDFFHPPLIYWTEAGPNTPVENFDFPGFILTTQDGTEYRIERKDEVEHFLAMVAAGENFVQAYSDLFLTRITTRKDDRLEFVRNGGGKITAIDQTVRLTERKIASDYTNGPGYIDGVYGPASLDDEGHIIGPALMTYAYDAGGNLVCANQLTDTNGFGNPIYQPIYLYV